jgi:translation initiation factor IF-2
MNISTLAKLLGTSINDLREIGSKNSIYGFYGRNTRIPYNSAVEITKLIRPEKLNNLKNDDKIYLPQIISVAEFSETIGKPVSLVIKNLMLSGVIATMNEKIDYDTASIIASDLGVEVFPEENVESSNNSLNLNSQMINLVIYDDEVNKNAVDIIRPPIITVMGHVDHGKTTLLDTIRKSNVVDGEAGSITQHISSYQIGFKVNDQQLKKLNLPIDQEGNYLMTFIDTPGHEAFTAMRARGSQLADYIILMVSSVEGPKPQTVEVIERAKLGKIPLIVALNKIDLPDSDPERVKNELTQYGLIPEEWGGDTPFISISAKSGLNIDKLLETILVYSDLNELKGQINVPGQAVIIENHLDPRLGVVGIVLVVKDKIKVGDIIRIGENVSKIRKIETTDGKSVAEAFLGQPAVVHGLSTLVNIGDTMIVYPSVKLATNDANTEKIKKQQNKKTITILSDTASQNQINLVLKADVAGSLEALKETILKIPQDKIKIIIKSEGVGAINQNDIDFAQTSSSTILSFHNEIPPKLVLEIEKKKVNLVESDIIYEIVEWVEEEILKSVKPETKQIDLGKAKVLATFKSEKSGIQVCGGECIDGKILSSKSIKIIRGSELLGEAEIVELQRNKVKSETVNISQQFGISLRTKIKIQKDDLLVSFDEVLVK